MLYVAIEWAHLKTKRKIVLSRSQRDDSGNGLLGVSSEYGIAHEWTWRNVKLKVKIQRADMRRTKWERCSPYLAFDIIVFFADLVKSDCTQSLAIEYSILNDKQICVLCF